MAAGIRINRNIVECKVKRFVAKPSIASVLIETSWNVKTVLRTPYADIACVLIETSWNVKLLLSKTE